MAKTAAGATAPAQHTELFTIPKRWSWLASVEVTIACDPAAPYGVKLGLAARVAKETGADLTGAVLRGADLTGADLRGADLTGADLTGVVLRGADLTGVVLRGADLRGADLRGADLTGVVLRGAVLRGAVLRGEKIARLIAAVDRQNDPYTFYAFELEAGGVKIKAGCRWFTMSAYRAHVAAEYADTSKGQETSDILDFFEARCRALGIPTEPASAEAQAA